VSKKYKPNLKHLPQAGDKKIQILKHTEKDYKLKDVIVLPREIQMPITALKSNIVLCKYAVWRECIQSTRFQTVWMISTGGMFKTGYSQQLNLCRTQPLWDTIKFEKGQFKY